MRRAVPLLVAFALAVAACSDSGQSATTGQPPAPTTAAPSTETTPPDDPSGTTTPPTTTAPGQDHLFSLVDTEAIGIGAEEWDGGFVGPGAISLVDDEYVMLYPGIPNRNATPGTTRAIGYAASRNGLDFFRQAEQPIIDPFSVPTVEPGTGILDPGNIVQEDDGTLVLYYSTRGDGGRLNSGTIGRATASDPAGPWTFDEEPIIMPGGPGEWDQLATVNPHVVKTADGYLMWYDGNMGDLDVKPTRHIGLATSDDGISWTKYDDPETTEPPFHVSDPVLRLSPEEDAWDSFRVYEPSVIPVDGGFVMFYGSDRRYDDQLERTWEFGYATSTDGVEWERGAANPIFSTLGDLFTLVFNATAERDPDGTWRVYFGAQNGISLPTSVRVIEYSGELP